MRAAELGGGGDVHCLVDDREMETWLLETKVWMGFGERKMYTGWLIMQEKRVWEKGELRYEDEGLEGYGGFQK